jgi:hypothetical protein
VKDDVKRWWENEKKRRWNKTKENVENYVETQMGLVADMNARVRAWIHSETRIRPAKFVQQLHDYQGYQDLQLDLTNEDTRRIPKKEGHRPE